MCACACVRAYVPVYLYACMRACARVWVCACVRACVCVCAHLASLDRSGEK